MSVRNNTSAGALSSPRLFKLVVFPFATCPTTRNAKSCVRFSSKQVKRVSYVGGDKGTLSRHDVLRALEELEVRVDGWEADALLDRFAVEDGDDKVILFRCVTNVGICFTN